MVSLLIRFFFSKFPDSGVESSTTTYAGHEGAASDCDMPPSQSIDEVASPAPTLEDAMQRLAETIKEFDSHAINDQENNTNKPCNDTTDTPQNQPQNVSQGQISFLFKDLFSWWYRRSQYYRSTLVYK